MLADPMMWARVTAIAKALLERGGLNKEAINQIVYDSTLAPSRADLSGARDFLGAKALDHCAMIERAFIGGSAHNGRQRRCSTARQHSRLTFVRNDNDDGLANRFIGGVAEDTRRPPVPICDDAIELLCKAQLWIILVTTSQFGPDAYSFAKDKPLTLLSGSELLGLLEQHG